MNPPRVVHRRAFLKGLGAAGLLLGTPLRALGSRLGTGTLAAGGWRESRLFSGSGLFAVHSDMHNHSLVSGDAVGNMRDAYGQMRASGLDVASLTEHAIGGKHHGEHWCSDPNSACRAFTGITENDWPVLGEIADAANADGAFTAIRGFEWTTATIGHVNVWFSEKWTDAFSNAALFSPQAISEVDRIAPVPSEIADQFENAPDTAPIDLFYEWLASSPARPVLGGGSDGIACFNHPGEFGDFKGYAYDPSVAPQIVACEALNADRDFFFYGLDRGKPNPLNAVLNAGWRVGFIGVSDEHSETYGRPGLGRGGLWVRELSRAGVREALAARRMYATFRAGLRLDATANGVPMGAAQLHGGGPVSVALDIDGGPDWAGKELVVEVIRPGAGAPVLADTIEIAVPADGPIVFTADVGSDRWMFLRVTDPERPADPLATGDYAAHGGAVAYASPFFFDAPSV